MSESSMNVATSQENSSVEVEPDFFGLYASEISSLLSQDDSSHSSSQQAGNTRGVAMENGKSCKGSFSKGVCALITDFKSERLKSLVRQSVFDLIPEIDQMVNPVLSLNRIRSCMKYKHRSVGTDSSVGKTDEPRSPPKKRKAASRSPGLNGEHKCLAVSGTDSPGDARSTNGTPSWNFAPDGTKIDADLRFILEYDSSRVEELMKAHSNDFFALLHDMEQRLEEILNHVMSTCRPMTRPEKRKLRKRIQKLTPESLCRVVEIIGKIDDSEKIATNEVMVELEDLDNVTPWRLYFYVTATRS